MILDRIVTVSKDPGVQQFAQNYGREVFGADDPADALDIVQTVNPNLILLDHRFEINHIREYFRRADNNSGQIPVVVVGSGNGDTEMSGEFMQMGAYGYLQGKQDHTQMEQLIGRIKNARDSDPGATGAQKEKTPTAPGSDPSIFFADELEEAR